MKGPQPPVVNLSQAEQQALEQLVNAHSTAQQIALRARIILTAHQGLNNEQVGRTVQVGVDMVRQWRSRWLAGQAIPLTELTAAERLQDLPRARQAVGDHRRSVVPDHGPGVREAGAIGAPDQPMDGP